MLAKQKSADSVLCPDIHSKRDLKTLSEVTDYDTGYDTGAFLRSTFTYVDEQDIAWFGRAPGVRKYDLTVDDLKTRAARNTR
jgi:hypothetical protein